jgi:hypothetical protein
MSLGTRLSTHVRASWARRAVSLARMSTSAQFGATTKLFINGEFVDSKTEKWIPVYNPVRVAVLNRCLFMFLIHDIVPTIYRPRTNC